MQFNIHNISWHLLPYVTLPLASNLKWCTMVFSEVLNKEKHNIRLISIVASWKIQHELNHIKKNQLFVYIWLDPSSNNFIKKTISPTCMSDRAFKVLWDVGWFLLEKCTNSRILNLCLLNAIWTSSEATPRRRRQRKCHKTEIKGDA